MFISTKEGKYVRTEDITSMDLKGDGSPTGVLTLRDGSTAEVEPHTRIYDIAELDFPIVAANSGFQLLWFGIDDADPKTYDIEKALLRTSIIAWRVPGNGQPRPITAEHNDWRLHCNGTSKNPDTYMAILDPAGPVLGPHEALWDSLAEWIAHIREEWAARLSTGTVGSVVPSDRHPAKAE